VKFNTIKTLATVVSILLPVVGSVVVITGTVVLAFHPISYWIWSNELPILFQEDAKTVAKCIWNHSSTTVNSQLNVLQLSYAELRHLADISIALMSAKRGLALEVCVLLIGSCILPPETLIKAYFRQFIITCLAIGSIALGIIFFWDRLWALFHRAFLDLETSTFNSNASIILLFPNDFWKVIVLYYLVFPIFLSYCMFMVVKLTRRY
jgi:hypothetical protein